MPNIKGIEDLKDTLNNKKHIHFVKWFVDGCKEEEWQTVTNTYLNNMKREDAMELLNREDIQNAVKEVVKRKKDMDLINIYKSMVKRALEGDVNSANWVAKFADSSFFKDSKSEIDKILDGLDIEE